MKLTILRSGRISRWPVTSERSRLAAAAILIVLLPLTTALTAEQQTGNRGTSPRSRRTSPRGGAVEVRALMEALAQGTPEEKTEAADKLVELGTRVIPALAVALQHPNEDVRECTVEILGRIADRRAIELLIQALSDEKPQVRSRVAQVLTKIGKPAVAPLQRALRNPRHRPAWPYAAGILERIKGTKAAKSLPASVKNRNSALSEVRSLARMRDPNTIEPLTRALRHPNPEVRTAAVEALGGIPDRRAIVAVARALTRRDPVVRSAAATALSHIDSPESTKALDAALRRRDLLVIATIHEYYIERIAAGKESILTKALEVHGTLEMAMEFLHCGNPVLSTAGERYLLHELYTSGTISAAEACLNSGSDPLIRAAEEWARVRGYEIVLRMDKRGIKPPVPGQERRVDYEQDGRRSSRRGTSR